MKPRQLQKLSLVDPKTPAQRYADLGPFAARHGKFPKGTVLPETQVPACGKVKVAEFPSNFIPKRFFEKLEHNQKIAPCCRHPEEHEIEARKSHPDEKAPDTYIFHCTCSRKHIIFCAGTFDTDRPFWVAEPT
jgi:hypothetical protein